MYLYQAPENMIYNHIRYMFELSSNLDSKYLKGTCYRWRFKYLGEV